jgi:hypothetical protein
MEELEKLPKEL